MTRGLAIFLMAGSVWGQAGPSTPVSEAQIEGQVLRDENGLPLRRAHLTLRPLQAGVTATGAEADDNGRFILRNISPGRYTLIAERDGYLTTASSLRGATRMPASFFIESGEKITNITFRMHPWAVLSGKVRFDDGEAGVGIRVELFREYRTRSRHSYTVVSGGVTDDRGEYRVYGLQPGAYFVAAVYERGPGVQDQPPTDAEGRELPVTGYTTTFFPNSEKLSEAAPVRLSYGKELEGIDVLLRQVRKVKIRGRVTSGVTGQRLINATITLGRDDGSGEGTIPTAVRPNFDREGNFEIRDVAPGLYTVFVQGTDAGQALAAHTLLTVGTEDLGGVELIPAPAQPWSGKIVFEGGGRWPANVNPRVTLDPRSANSPTVQPNVRAMTFECVVMKDESYDVYIDNLVGDYYVSAVRMNGSDLRASGLPGSLAAQVPFEIVLDSRGGRLSGIVVGPEGELWSGANLMLIPESAQSRLQDYRSASADRYGQFQFRGIAPGRYVLAAWLDEAPCDVYDPNNLDACRAAGMTVTVGQASGESILFNVKAR